MYSRFGADVTVFQRAATPSSQMKIRT